ncbi:hypothetical protein HOA91_05525 [Candidatus Woesearchaeota archaeon]|jgi:hypothetical protein|nr:hypothetical protein [Candidatus Woesearchaeota archaeon]
MEKDLENVVNLDFFHPTWDAKAEAPKFIKEEHQYNPEETGNQIPLGLIVESRSGSIHFTYMALDHLPNKVEDYFLRKAKVLKSYLGVSYDSFCMAEKIFNRGLPLDRLDRVDKELTISEQEKEKIKKYRTN